MKRFCPSLAWVYPRRCFPGQPDFRFFEVFTALPYMIVPPVLVLALLMVSFTLLADELRDAFEPR